ncbi:amidohydrolase [Facilibium subflavum]|uniref:amidohydrolase n=1 Tax=Facilibium subflavum TaxID=2219058 RepID=UPI000E64B3FC|nr:amidohydrolase [Facilibium subflavum]
MSNLTVAVIQSDIAWEDPTANYHHFDNIIRQIHDQVDLIILPEMFNVGFSPNIEHALSNQGNVIEWMYKHAKQKHAAITGSVMVLNNENKPVNRLIFVTAEKKVYTYDKRHLFVLSDEAHILAAGDKRVIIEYKGFNILPSICFDLRFPVFNCNNNDYDLLINIASWPAKRRDHWRTLLKARAIENQAYVVGCNRIGTDGLGIDYTGDSLCINFDGTIVQQIDQNTPGVLVHQFDKKALIQYRQSFQMLASQDNFSLHINK